MGPRYLLDSNIIIYFTGNIISGKGKDFLDEVISIESNISVISKIEVLGWNPPNKLEYFVLAKFIADCYLYELTSDIVDESIRIKRGKKIMLGDSIIAVTALVHGYALVSRNTKANLQVINPFEL